jgi:hypothetical protein
LHATHLSETFAPIELTVTGRKISNPVWFVQAKYGAPDIEAYYPRQDVAVEVPLT